MKSSSSLSELIIPAFYQLVQVDAFYIEIVYESPFNTSKGMFAFDDTDLLDPYLTDIAPGFFEQ